MRNARPIVAVTTGGTATGKTTKERTIGTLRPILTPGGEDSGEYLVIGNSGYNEAVIRQVGPEGWSITTGDPYDMDSPKKLDPRTYHTRSDAVGSVARKVLTPLATPVNYIKYGNTRA
ncbi:hypothetical protein [Streptomyces sp. NPDC088727]|uniref:hypothetical protein n=1 Tax=Streptomyces sp. NPDC088727 TaxID=3365875 RepID=UPI0038034C21